MKHEALIERLATTCHGLDPVDPLRLLVDDVIAALREPEQEPVAIYQYQTASGAWVDQEKHSYDYNVRHGQATVRIVYTTPPQRTEQNFCPRCGKRTPDLITIHTCTPPQENT